MDQLLEHLRRIFPEISFVAGEKFYWSPASRKVFYIEDSASLHGPWSLLHETSHALLDHTRYVTDIELLLLEIEAWDRAKMLATEFGFTIDEEHIQDCLDTYRDWLYMRSTCPQCGAKGLQIVINRYQCFNCHADWRVAQSRFCRPYRVNAKYSPDMSSLKSL